MEVGAQERKKGTRGVIPESLGKSGCLLDNSCSVISCPLMYQSCTLLFDELLVDRYLSVFNWFKTSQRKKGGERGILAFVRGVTKLRGKGKSNSQTRN